MHNIFNVQLYPFDIQTSVMNVVDGERLKSFLEKRECDKIVVSKMLQECLKFDNNYAIKHHFASRNDFFC